MKVSRVVGPALLGACLYGAVTNSYPTDAEKDAFGDAAATNAVEQAGVAALLGLRTTLGMTEAEIIAAIRAPHTVSQTPPEAARNSERQPWNLRGAWDDDFYFGFSGDWMFPLGTNHLAGVIVHSQGDLSASSCELPFAALPLAMAMVPGDSSFATEFTPSNSYAFVWTQVRPGRLAEEKLDARIELFRNGNYTVSTNGCVTDQFVREPPFPHVGIGQDDDWVCANFTNAADILSVGYANWVDAQVGVDLTNGLYKFTATFPDDPPEATELIVGDLSVCVTNAGEYVFVLEKGVEYDFGTNPYDATVEYSMQDDLMDAPVFANWWLGDDNGVWTIDGGWHELYLPWLTYLGSCYWEPKFRGAPDVTNLSTADFPMTFTALLTDCCHTNGVTYHWTTDDERVYIASPYSQTTQVEIDSCFDAETFSLSVEAHAPDRTYYSTLISEISTNNVRGLSLSMPDTLFVNNDDDGGDGEMDCGPDTDGEDDVACATANLSFPAAVSGTLTFECADGFTGDVYEESASDSYSLVSPGTGWRFTGSPTYRKTLYFDAKGKSAGYRQSSVKFRWTPDAGDQSYAEHRFTVVEPVVEPICKETTNVVENGVDRELVVNPCGVGIGRDAYFRIKVLPRSFPDSEIVWSAVGDGSVDFPAGNAGRAVRVRGLGAGGVELQIKIGDCESRVPSFSLRVVENRVVKLSAWILTDRNGVPVRTIDSVRNIVKKAEDIYSQVGVTFDLADRIVVTNMNGTAQIARGGESDDMISFTNLVNAAHGTGGLELYFIESFYNVTNNDATLSKVVGVNSPEGLAVAKSATATTLAHEIGHAFGLRDIYEAGFTLGGGVEYVCYDNMPFDWSGGCHGRGNGGTRYYAKGLMQINVIQRLLMNGEPSIMDLGADITAGYVGGFIYGSDHIENVWDLVNIGFFVPNALAPIHQ